MSKTNSKKAAGKCKRTATLAEYVKSFTASMGAALQNIENAARSYAEACKKFPDTAQQAFERAYPHVTPNTWDKLMAVGCGDANASIMLFSDKFAKKIMRMPKSTQDEVLNGQSFVVFNPTTRKAEQVGYSEIKPRHERILFDEAKARIRTIPEQVAYSEIMLKESLKSSRPYIVHTDRVHILRECEIGREEWAAIGEEMEA